MSSRELQTPLLISTDVSVDDVGEASFEGAAGFVFGFVLGEFALEVQTSRAGIAGLAHCDGVQCRVELAVAAGVESVSDLVAAGGIEWCGAGVAGEVVGGGESSDVADVAEDFGGQDESETVDVGKSAAGCGQGVAGLGLVVFEALIDAAQVAEQLTGQIPATCLGRGAGTDGAQQRGCLVRGQAL